ncbi:MAG: nucleotidyltransferase domain-containing protein [Thermomicrobiales bacterium]|nr:nucleotidyltransferase domain-containing protein [Thermomicrobiales bacterium]
MSNAPECLNVDFLAPFLPAIHALCRRYQVSTLDVFGSVCRPDFSAESDIDFLVDYPADLNLGPWLRDYHHFQRDLASLLQRDVDLVMASALRKPYFRAEVEATRVRVFDATSDSAAA